MTEDFLHYIWKYRLVEQENFATTEGERIDVLNPGIHNTDAGPDFFNAKIKIGDTQWVGNVEIHINTSDWAKHKHDSDKAYDNVILHLVGCNDIDENTISRSNGQKIPLAQLSYNRSYQDNYKQLNASNEWVACSKWLNEIDSFTTNYWLNKVLIERLSEKTTYISDLLTMNNNSWEDTYYQHLARTFGLSINSIPFEMMARALPLIYIGKHKSNITQVEALLFGQAGMLEGDDCTDDYYLMLKKEYQFLRHKFNLTPIEKHLWKFLRLRPANFPTIRIAQFAQLIHRSSSLFSKIIDIASNEKGEVLFKKISDLFDMQTSPYWETHYTFGKESKKRTKKIGSSFIHILLINSIVPFLFARGASINNENLKTRSLELLEEIKPEKNSIIEQWNNQGIKADNAYTSQALIHLKKNYCDKGQCLNCQIGSRVITNC